MEEIKDKPNEQNKYTKQQILKIRAGSEKIPDFTWHHNAQSAPNSMQLVPTSVHNAVQHIGQGTTSKGK